MAHRYMTYNAGAETREMRYHFPVESPATGYATSVSFSIRDITFSPIVIGSALLSIQTET